MKFFPLFGRTRPEAPASHTGVSTTPAPDVSPQEARRRQQQGALLVDVRESDEWAAGHAAGAIHLPLGQLATRQAELPRDREVLLICASGSRSALATDRLRRAGHPHATNVEGGTAAWARAGLPLER